MLNAWWHCIQDDTFSSFTQSFFLTVEVGGMNSILFSPPCDEILVRLSFLSNVSFSPRLESGLAGAESSFAKCNRINITNILNYHLYTIYTIIRKYFIFQKLIHIISKFTSKKLFLKIILLSSSVVEISTVIISEI